MSCLLPCHESQKSSPKPCSNWKDLRRSQLVTEWQSNYWWIIARAWRVWRTKTTKATTDISKSITLRAFLPAWLSVTWSVANLLSRRHAIHLRAPLSIGLLAMERVNYKYLWSKLEPAWKLSAKTTLTGIPGSVIVTKHFYSVELHGLTLIKVYWTSVLLER